MLPLLGFIKNCLIFVVVKRVRQELIVMLFFDPLYMKMRRRGLMPPPLGFLFLFGHFVISNQMCIMTFF